ncbi:acyl-CoA thioesterase [Pelagibacterium lentulum]|uniref:Thioesterase n=1 Tax=Pelagibacterium lentulum TaxID=2029865 RepID=A0A916R7K8_9HYPH|nr:thioesterase family protein [Pelagibacterium lentulum]GGA40349.1 thioesterase [Pelagibacterium lentulum]
MTDRAPAGMRSDYLAFTSQSLRWNDNDVFGHVNNAEYYALFDTAVVRFLIESGEIAISGGALGMVVVESGCRFHREVVFTDSISVGMRVAHIGRTSVRYDLAIFCNSDATAAAEGHFVHVFVDRNTKRPTEIPAGLRAHFQSLAIGA